LRVHFESRWDTENAVLYGETEFEVRSGYVFYTGCTMIRTGNGPLMVGMCSADPSAKCVTNRSYGYTPNLGSNAVMIKIEKEVYT